MPVFPKKQGFNLRSGNGPLAFKNMGGSPTKHEGHLPKGQTHFHGEGEPSKDNVIRTEKEAERFNILTGETDIAPGITPPNTGLTPEITNVRGRIKFDPHTDKIIESSLKPTVVDGKKIAPTREDLKLANKYQTLTTKRDITNAKLAEQKKGGGWKGRKLTRKVSKTQEKFDKLDKELTTLSAQYDKINKSNPKDPRLDDLDKQINKLTNQHAKVEGRLDKRKDKQWDYEQDIKEGKKVVKGNIFTRMKSNRQDREARRQRTYLNYSDRERWQYRQNKINSLANVVNVYAGGKSKPVDWSNIPDDQRELKNYKSFNDRLKEIENISQKYKKPDEE